MYKVIAQLDRDGEATGEYTGITYNRYEDARRELLDAKADVQIFFAWIEKVE